MSQEISKLTKQLADNEISLKKKEEVVEVCFSTLYVHYVLVFHSSLDIDFLSFFRRMPS